MRDWFDDLHPYYQRKAERNAEFLDKALIPFFKWSLLAFAVLLLLGV